MTPDQWQKVQDLFSAALDLPADQRDDYEERAASLEYENGFTREAAEILALTDVRRRMRQQA